MRRHEDASRSDGEKYRAAIETFRQAPGRDTVSNQATRQGDVS